MNVSPNMYTRGRVCVYIWSVAVFCCCRHKKKTNNFILCTSFCRKCHFTNVRRIIVQARVTQATPVLKVNWEYFFLETNGKISINNFFNSLSKSLISFFNICKVGDYSKIVCFKSDQNKIIFHPLSSLRIYFVMGLFYLIYSYIFFFLFIHQKKPRQQQQHHQPHEWTYSPLLAYL